MKSSHNGFSLMEVLVAMVIFSISALAISFVVFRSECHGQNASSMIVDCVIKRLDWRTSPWRHLWCHPLGCLS